MTLLRWHHSNRAVLTETLPEAIVLLPIGATEQHGPHLATGTDWMLAQAVTEQAATLAHERVSRPLVLAPALPYGASDHHLPFGGTLSLSPETLLGLLLDLTRSLAACGGKRLVIVNGHGGNVGICATAASAAANRYAVSVAHLDYWRLARDLGDTPAPGHAGVFETALMLAQDESFVADRAPRQEPPANPAVDDVTLHDADSWRRIDGYTDHPEHADAATGRVWFDQLATALGDRLITLAEAL
ncbi:creatininase family protein [Kribbella sandramycini]|uniref:Creatininase family protein n=1 Tax=Kribbella sandramycini TaxID=60450 RepID=A0A7Y4KWI1_9ACTN|nr:creatininase family protein [Kribbella sandramycini]MBB6568261.1 creatinine amidohydrolase [Kribbella sandramycini]NOL39146.1 creatininase family protein [Kribbella sandramycini]